MQLNRENVESSLRMQVRLALDNIDKEGAPDSLQRGGCAPGRQSQRNNAEKLRDRERPHISTSAMPNSPIHRHSLPTCRPSTIISYRQSELDTLLRTRGRSRNLPLQYRKNKTHSIKSTHEKQCIFPLLAILVLLQDATETRRKPRQQHNRRPSRPYALETVHSETVNQDAQYTANRRTLKCSTT